MKKLQTEGSADGFQGSGRRGWDASKRDGRDIWNVALWRDWW